MFYVKKVTDRMKGTSEIVGEQYLLKDAVHLLKQKQYASPEETFFLSEFREVRVTTEE